MPLYLVVARCPSAIRIAQDAALTLNYLRPDHPCDIQFYTRYILYGTGEPLPGDLIAEVRGSGEPFSDTITFLTNAAREMAIYLTISANAAVGELDVDVAYNIDQDVSEREFFQQVHFNNDQPPRQTRQVDVEATVKLMEAVDANPFKESLGRAVAHYSEALGSWRFGQEVGMIDHLWMGMEALRPAARARFFQDKELTDPADAVKARDLLGVPNTNQIEPGIRLSFLFRGDIPTHEAAKNARSDIQHPKSNFSDIRTRARGVAVQTASYLRSAILDLSALDAATRGRLLAPPFDEPIGNWPLVTYVWGNLIGEGNSLAASERAHPDIRVTQSIKSVSRTTSGGYEIKPEITMTPAIGEGIGFQPTRFEVWVPGKIPK